MPSSRSRSFQGTFIRQLNLAHPDITKTDKRSTEKVVAVLENDVGSSEVTVVNLKWHHLPHRV